MKSKNEFNDLIEIFKKWSELGIKTRKQVVVQTPTTLKSDESDVKEIKDACNETYIENIKIVTKRISSMDSIEKSIELHSFKSIDLSKPGRDDVRKEIEEQSDIFVY